MSGAVFEAVSGDGRKGFSGRFKDTHGGGDGSLLTRPPKVALGRSGGFRLTAHAGWP